MCALLAFREPLSVREWMARRAMGRRGTLLCLAVLFAVLFAGCSSDEADDLCFDLLPEYRAAMDEALVCDPAQQDPCGAGRPILVFSESTQAFTALCAPPCLGAVNPASTAKLDEILQRFEARGCKLRYCPCPPPEFMPPTCSASGETGTCWGYGPAPPHLPPSGW